MGKKVVVEGFEKLVKNIREERVFMSCSS